MPTHDDDTQAILRRRRFLIQSALAGAGLGALLTGCRPEPHACLSVVPAPPKPPTGPKICLKPVAPHPCLKVAPPRPCLKIAPKPCLSIRKER